MRDAPRGPITFDELTAGLIWPKLLRCFALAVQPARMAVAFLMVIAIMFVGTALDVVRSVLLGPFDADAGETPRVFGRFIGEVASSFNGFVVGALTLDLGRAWQSLSAMFLDAPAWLLREHWLFGAALLLLLVPVWAVGGAAVCRMTACDLGMGLHMSARDGLRFGMERWRSAVGSLVSPLVMVLVIAVLAWLFGVALLRLPVLNLLGGLLYGAALALGLVATLIVIVYVVGHALLLPAVATDGSDAIDAVQRAVAYVLGRPGRYVVYAAILDVCGILAYAALAFGVSAAINTTASWTGASLGENPMGGGAVIFDFAPVDRSELTGTRGVAAGLINVWERALVALLGAFVLSFYFTGSTILYMLMRRVNDEQDIEDVWTPRVVPGSDAPAKGAPAWSANGDDE